MRRILSTVATTLLLTTTANATEAYDQALYLLEVWSLTEQDIQTLELAGGNTTQDAIDLCFAAGAASVYGFMVIPELADAIKRPDASPAQTMTEFKAETGSSVSGYQYFDAFLTELHPDEAHDDRDLLFNPAVRAINTMTGIADASADQVKAMRLTNKAISETMMGEAVSACLHNTYPYLVAYANEKIVSNDIDARYTCVAARTE